MKQNKTTPIDSFPGLLSKPISICNTKTLYKFKISHLYGFMCQLLVLDYNTEEIIIDMVQNIEYIEDLVITVDNLKLATILYGKS